MWRWVQRAGEGERCGDGYEGLERVRGCGSEEVGEERERERAKVEWGGVGEGGGQVPRL